MQLSLVPAPLEGGPTDASNASRSRAAATFSRIGPPPRSAGSGRRHVQPDRAAAAFSRIGPPPRR